MCRAGFTGAHPIEACRNARDAHSTWQHHAGYLFPVGNENTGWRQPLDQASVGQKAPFFTIANPTLPFCRGGRHTTLCRGGEATSVVVIPHAARSSTYAWHDQESGDIGQQNSFANLYILIRVGPDNGSALFKSSCNDPARGSVVKLIKKSFLKFKSF